MPKPGNADKLKQMKSVGYKDQIKYNKTHLKHIGLNLNIVTEAEYLAFWESLPNKRQWIIGKMREDMGYRNIYE